MSKDSFICFFLQLLQFINLKYKTLLPTVKKVILIEIYNNTRYIGIIGIKYLIKHYTHILLCSYEIYILQNQ